MHPFEPIFSALKECDPSARGLLDECCDSYRPRNGVIWYPSSGDDYRDILELSPERRRTHGLKVVPWLFVHTTQPFSHFGDGPLLFRDNLTTVNVCREARLEFDPRAITDPGIRDAHFDERLDDSQSRGMAPTFGREDVEPIGPTFARLMEVEVVSNTLGTHRAWVLAIGMTNYEFFINMVVSRRLRFQVLVQVRQGLGFGGCGLGLAYLLPWLWWAGCREMVCDGEISGIGSALQEVQRRVVARGAPIHPPAFTAEHGASFKWSCYDVAPARLTAIRGKFHRRRGSMEEIELQTWARAGTGARQRRLESMEEIEECLAGLIHPRGHGRSHLPRGHQRPQVFNWQY